MKFTVPYLTCKFHEFNRQFFGNKLPEVPLLLSESKTFLGKCCYEERRNLMGKSVRSNFVLRFNVRVDLPEEELEDIILHEMIHYCIDRNQWKDTSPHGQLFRRFMNDFNEKYGRHIRVSYPRHSGLTPQLVDTRPKWHVIALVNFSDGRLGVKVLPRIEPRITNYYNKCLTSSRVSSIELYMSSDAFFNRFPCSSALNVCFHDAAELKAHLQGAEHMKCEGTKIIRNVQQK